VPKKKKDDWEDWIEALIALGIGALAIHFLSKLFEQASKPPREAYYICPNCGASTRKWSRMCPTCRIVLTWR